MADNGMFVFVWQEIERCTDNWHSEGGVVVIASSLERAKQLAEEKGCTFADDEQPDIVSRLYDWEHEEKIFIMPNAGCC